MKNKIFDFRLYVQGLNRLRVIGIALAILCITVSVLIPTVHWINEAKLQESTSKGYSMTVGGEILTEQEYRQASNKPSEIKDRKLIQPVLVASYLAPVLVLIMFSYLNKRSESDFYHAIPHKRSCVFVSNVCAVMSWMWSVLVVGGLVAGLLWAICPYTTYSFGGLLGEILLACLNAALLAAFTTVGVSLTGTLTTSLVTTLLLLGSWRGVLCIAYICFKNMLYTLVPQYMLGGYLSPDFFLPITIFFGNESGNVDGRVIVYAVVVTLAMFALGGLLYVKRRSELAGRAVPGRALHIALRCLISLPLGLLVVYMLIVEESVVAALVFLVCMLLVFYLYELLTTKRVKSMLRATPWLGVVFGACLLFTGAVYLTEYADDNEAIAPERIAGVQLIDWELQVVQTEGQTTVVGANETRQMMQQMSDDPEAIALVSEAFTKPGGYEQKGSIVRVRIKLKSGICVVRKLHMWQEDYNALLREMQDDLQTSVIPPKEDIWLYRLQAWGQLYEIPAAWFDVVWQALEQDVANMTLKQKADFLRGKYDDGTHLDVTTYRDKDGNADFFSYCIDPTCTPLAYQAIESALDCQTPEIRNMVDVALSKTGKIGVGFIVENGNAFGFKADHMPSSTVQGALDILKACIEKGASAGENHQTLMFHYMVTYEENGQTMYLIVPFTVAMSHEDYTAFMKIFVDDNLGK